MVIYIDDGKTVRAYYTDNNKIGNAISTMLENTEEVTFSETFEGYDVLITKIEGETK